MAGTVRTNHPEAGVIRAVWPSIVNADTNGDAAQLSRWPHKSVQVEGGFGSAGGITIQGSNDGTNYHTLQDHLGNDLIFTADGLATVAENTLYIRPTKSGADAALDVAVTIIGV